MRTAAAALAGLLALSAPAARAGDAAELVVHGFAADGSVFAFEENGRRDGSAAPYAAFYVVDTASDSWLPGTPVRVQLDQPGATPAQARTELGRQARPFLDRFALQPGDTQARFDAGAPDEAVRVAAALLPARGPAEIRLVERPATEARHCDGVATGVVGYELALFQNERRTSLDLSTAIPRSRGCPLAYSLARVVTFAGPNRRVLVVVVAVFSAAPEGPDRRFIAVAKTLP